MRYRRVFIPGASYFFTLVTHERSPIFAEVAAIDLYRGAVRKVRTARPFTRWARSARVKAALMRRTRVG